MIYKNIIICVEPATILLTVRQAGMQMVAKFQGI